jgi:hypothetical protein
MAIMANPCVHGREHVEQHPVNGFEHAPGELIASICGHRPRRRQTNATTLTRRDVNSTFRRSQSSAVRRERRSVGEALDQRLLCLEAEAAPALFLCRNPDAGDRGFHGLAPFVACHRSRVIVGCCKPRESEQRPRWAHWEAFSGATQADRPWLKTTTRPSNAGPGGEFLNTEADDGEVSPRPDGAEPAVPLSVRRSWIPRQSVRFGCWPSVRPWSSCRSRSLPLQSSATNGGGHAHSHVS